jgi:putative ABC transport system ATP-binding protein
MTMPATVAIRDLVVEYSSGGYLVRPVDSLNLDFGDGELVLLLGASGCGKTTLLSALASILTPTSGSIQVGDTEVVGLRGRALREYRRRQVGIVFQAFNLVPSLNALENTAMPLWEAGWRARQARERAVELLRDVDLGEYTGRRPSELSGGQQQRVAIARALAHDPPLVLADEPTAHLDYIQVEGVLRLLRETARPGRIVVVATHDDRLLPLADRIVELSPVAKPTSAEPVRVELAAGEVLFQQGDVGSHVYLVESGEIDLVRVRDDGQEEIIARAQPGGYFGELAPIFGIPRSATARASQPSVVTGYTPADFREQAGPGAVRDLIAGHA